MTSPGKNTPAIYEFGSFRLNVDERTLQSERGNVQLTPKVFDTLLALIERRGQLLRKDELMEILWPNTFVEERNLAQNIFLLRKALGTGESEQQFIQTVPKSGYRFVMEVREVHDESSVELKPHFKRLLPLTLFAATSLSVLGFMLLSRALTKTERDPL